MDGDVLSAAMFNALHHTALHRAGLVIWPMIITIAHLSHGIGFQFHGKHSSTYYTKGPNIQKSPTKNPVKSTEFFGYFPFYERKT